MGRWEGLNDELKGRRRFKMARKKKKEIIKRIRIKGTRRGPRCDQVKRVYLQSSPFSVAAPPSHSIIVSHEHERCSHTLLHGSAFIPARTANRPPPPPLPTASRNSADSMSLLIAITRPVWCSYTNPVTTAASSPTRFCSHRNVREPSNDPKKTHQLLPPFRYSCSSPKIMTQHNRQTTRPRRSPATARSHISTPVTVMSRPPPSPPLPPLLPLPPPPYPIPPSSSHPRPTHRQPFVRPSRSPPATLICSCTHSIGDIW